MTDNENILIEDFFKQAARQQIEDNGFTERVMQGLPVRNVNFVHLLSRLWTLFCLIVSIVLFFVLNGWDNLKSALQMLLTTGLTAVEVFITTAPTADVHLDPVVLLLMLAFVGVFLPYRTFRRLSATL